ncbi:MAG: C25 family cysteine peptidase [Pyrinomonadaceae bacterium]
MKTTSAAFLLITLTLSAIFPAFGQRTPQRKSATTFETRGKGPADRDPVTRPRVIPSKEFAQFENVEAFTDGGGSYIRWQMASETGNLGFLVYRYGRRSFVQASENLITGSMAKIGKEVLYGGKYEFFDVGGTLGSTYVIQAIGPDGRRLQSMTITASYTADIGAVASMAKEDLVKVTLSNNGDLRTTPFDLTPETTAKPTKDNANSPSLTESANLSVHRAVVAQTGAKIAVKKDGFYRVRISELQAATNIFTTGNTANWRLYRDGIEQSMIIGADGIGVYMDFYGKAIETQESDTAIYYLIVDAVNTGKRIPSQRIKRVDITGASPSYSAVTSKRERVTYDSSILNGDEENFWGNAVINSPKNVVVALTGVDFSVPTFTVNLKMQGYSASVTPSVRVVLNGTEIGIANAAFPRQNYSAQFSVPTNLLVEGNNTFQLTSLNGGGDISYFDSIRLQYNRGYIAESNTLLFTGAPTKTMTLSGFSSASVRIFNIGTDGSPTQLIGSTVQQVGPGSYSVQYPATRQRLQPIFAVEDSGLLQSPSVTINNPTNLSSTVRNADLVIISHSPADFMAASNTWADYRRSAAGGSFNVEVVDVADIFDEYSYGVSSSDAVHSFLQHVYQDWTSQVAGKKYVLLIGDASYDPKNFKLYGSFNHVPTRIINTIYNEVPSDDLLADFNADGLADMAIGRVAARSVSEITTIFNKTTAFETPAMQSMSRGVLFAYDKPNGYQFGVMSEDLANQLPGAVPKTYVPRGLLPPEDPMTTDPQALNNLVNAINAPNGKYIVNYSGHGAQSTWDANFLSNASVPQLTNSNGLAVFTMLTCLNGFFTQPRPVIEDSIAELLVKSSVGGGPASWASSGKTTADVQMLMGRQFFQQVGIGNIKRMGDLVIDAKAQTPAYSDVMTTWILFGDPMLKVRE